MKALSIKQPWASLIVSGVKDIENRTWKCPTKYIGQRILIHASRKPDKEPYMIFNDLQGKVIDPMIIDICESYNNNSMIVGSVEIVGCTINHSSIWAEKSLGIAPVGGHVRDETKPIIWNWVLANPILFKNPITGIKGKLSLWESGYKEVKIVCPQCGSIETAIEDYNSRPWATYIHNCSQCEYVIMESEWEEVTVTKQLL